jgi:glutamyl-Q tRNA(Asp) synthetase
MLVTRFAPSPTGFLHLGSAYAAVIAHDAARAQDGRFLLRIEDIDATRCRPEFETAIREDLSWLGLCWDGPVLRQSERLSSYHSAIRRLDALGLVYPCFCSRKDIAQEVARSLSAPHGPDGPIYPGTCRSLSPQEASLRMRAETYALRLDVAKAVDRSGSLAFEEQGRGPLGEHGRITAEPMRLGDIVLASRDRAASYHLAVVVDDAAQGVSLVTRGQDLFGAAHVQRLLQALLALPTPAYFHHDLVLDAEGRKFSKRDHGATLRALRAEGRTADEIRSRLRLRAGTSLARTLPGT